MSPKFESKLSLESEWCWLNWLILIKLCLSFSWSSRSCCKGLENIRGDHLALVWPDSGSWNVCLFMTRFCLSPLSLILIKLTSSLSSTKLDDACKSDTGCWLFSGCTEENKILEKIRC